MTQIALYWEYSKDPAAFEALRHSTDFHKYYTYLDGTPVETINDRNRYWSVSMWGHFGFSHFPDGRRYAAFLTGFVPPNGGDWLSLGRIAQNALYYHEKCGLIITGANSKLQPELATFTEKILSHITHTPLTSHLQMGDKIDKLALGYDVFFAEMEVPVPSDQQIKFRIATTYKWGEAEAKMTLQLVLKAGQVLETGTGKKIILGKEKINLDASELGGCGSGITDGHCSSPRVWS
jgi:hypothetical protein